MSRARRVAIGVGVLVALQAILLVAWRARVDASSRLAEGEPASGVAPPLSLELRDGSRRTFEEAAAGRVALVHFWATWCVPCRDELPRLAELDAALAGRIPVVLVALDERWETIDHFDAGLAGRTARALDPRQVAAWGTSELPETWLVSADGVRLRRWLGPQDWDDPEAGERLLHR